MTYQEELSRDINNMSMIVEIMELANDGFHDEEINKAKAALYEREQVMDALTGGCNERN